MDEEADEAIAYMRAEWDCPLCATTNEEDHDPSGETLECEECGAKVRIQEMR